MSSSDALVLIGSRSRAAQAIALAAERPAIGVSRTSGEPGAVSVVTYTQASAAVIPTGATVVNCVGLASGSRAALETANLTVAIAWAAAAARAGARRFIQLSSFSVYGHAARIEAGTAERPDSAYGRSKLAADRALGKLAAPGFSVAVLRVPMLFGPYSTDKLASLITGAVRSGLIPRPTFPVERSMLGYGLLGAVVERIERENLDGVLHAADPIPFTYDLLATAARQDGLKFRRPVVPRLARSILGLAVPRLTTRLFGCSLLAPELNLAQTLPSELEHTIGVRLGAAMR